MRLDPFRLGIAAGTVWGIGVLITVIANIWVDYGQSFVRLLVDIYPGFRPNMLGALLGMVYAFADAFVGFFLIGWIYNFMSKGTD